jgi:hypothetical protein
MQTAGSSHDPFVRAHRASRARLNSEPRIQRLVFNNAGQAKPTILVDGQIVGVWSQPTVTVPSNLSWEPLVELNPATQTAIDAKLTEMAAMLSTGDKAR